MGIKGLQKLLNDEAPAAVKETVGWRRRGLGLGAALATLWLRPPFLDYDAVACASMLVHKRVS